MEENANTVVLSRGALHALMAVAVLGAAIASGTLSGLLARGGVDVWWGRAFSFPLVALALYPVMKAWAALHGTDMRTPCWRWAAIWIVVLFAGNAFVGPIVQRLIG